MSKDIEGIVNNLKDWGWSTEGGKEAFTHAQMNQIRTTLQSQADQYERERAEMVREILKECVTYGRNDPDGTNFEFEFVHKEDIETIAQKYGVDLSE